MEYLVVHFVRSRRVKVDDEFWGQTEELFELERGLHEIKLGYPPNFTPEVATVRLKNTTEFTPRHVYFKEVRAEEEGHEEA